MKISERLQKWLYEDDGLDQEIEHSVAGVYDRSNAPTAEEFARYEN